MTGKIVHFELPAKDGDRGQQFWSGLFGWSFESAGMPGADYRLTKAGGDPAGALSAMEGTTPGLLAYFDTEEIDAHVAKVRELGGTAEDKAPIPGVGWFAHCVDSEGNRFGLFQSDESLPFPSG
jgi:predicted enzyme related to lactoylglutathione lyase